MNCNVFNANIIKRSVGFLIHRQLLQLIQGLQAINNFAKHSVLHVEVRLLAVSDEELRSIGIWTIVCH